MAEPVEFSVEEALEILRAADETRRRQTDTPARRERLMGAACLFLFFLLIAGGIRVLDKFNDFYINMEISPSGMTAFFVNTGKLLSAQPWLLTGGMFAATWLYFSYVARRNRWLAIFHFLLTPATILLIISAAIALTLPMCVLMEKVGK